MTRIQYYTATSVDGFIADADNSLGWLFEVDSEGPDMFGPFMAEVGAFAMGSTTYEWLIEQEDLVDHPEKWREWHGDMPCWVFTHRDLPGYRERTSGSSAAMSGRFADHGLLDEIILSVAPVTLGAGAPLLPRRLMPSRLRLVAATRQGQFAQLRYAVGAPD
jgi:dihydrofolate reductase